ncbi:MAG TPA: GMC family oxidoreductase [Ramlibacter sp.]|nr:GMC family oxidoreductase [Ramlibacter sp.]
MHIDARLVTAQLVHCDVCIIGAGPAGISLAREFIGARHEVVLLESGGFEANAAAQALADGPTHGDVKPSIEVNRRQFGGNSNVWRIDVAAGEVGLRHAIFDEIDFQPRAWMPNSGWPIARDQLIPYYERAQSVCGAGPFLYRPEAFESANVKRLPLEDSDLQTGMFQFGPAAVFNAVYRDELFAAPNVRLYTWATAIELVPRESGEAVSCLRVARPGGAPFWISARKFVLAAGGFENPRLLLMSNHQQAAGLGNRHDVVGRYYHDHLQGRSGYFVPTDAALFEQARLYDLRRVNGVAAMGFLKLSPQAMERDRLPNINCMLYPRPAERQTRAIESFNSLRELRRSSGARAEPVSVYPHESQRQHLLNVMRGIDYVGKMAYLARTHRQSTSYGLGHGGWSQLNELGRRFTRFEVWHSIEQSPHRDNRVTLSPERDAYGCPKLQLDWHWPAQDIAATLRAQRLIASELARCGLGRLRLELDPQGLPNIVRPVGSHHLMGTTRMHDDPKQGVVDAHCRVHGVANLFVAGSSTFPAGGYANPTLTIVAMSLRIADRLKSELAAEHQVATPTAAA